MTVVAEAFGADLVSAHAAGFWEPYKLSQTPPDRVNAWAAETYEHIRELVHSPDAAAAGVSTVRATSLFRAPTPDPFWAPAAGGVARAPARELELYSAAVDWAAPDVAGAAGGSGGGLPDAWVDGYVFDSFLCEGR